MTLVPPSIRHFRLVYGVVVLLSALNVVLIWPTLSATVARNPALGGAGPAVQVAVVLIGLAIPALIWWFAGWRRSRIARIVLVLVVAVALLSLVRGLAVGQLVLDTVGLVRLAALVLQLVALVLLFRPDAAAWFRRASVSPVA